MQKRFVRMTSVLEGHKSLETQLLLKRRNLHNGNRRLTVPETAKQRQISRKIFLSTICPVYENAWNNLWPDLEGKTYFNDDHGEENIDFLQTFPRISRIRWRCRNTWIACDAEDYELQMLTDHEIVTSVQEESDPADDETDEYADNKNKESSKGPSNADAFSALETSMEWYEQQSECCPTQLLLLKRIRDLPAKKKVYNGTAKNK
ncbi:hypothetical protein TNCV_2245761 [Trichonephila clavipes]|nr:hypothetical protein TNCV_2245761 [Trichonephila clavipes]